MQKLRRSYGRMDPDRARCRTSSVGAVIPGTKREMYYCGIDEGDCRYAIPVGFDYVCKHPDNHLFLSADEVDPAASPVKFFSDSPG